MLNPVMNCCYC